MKSKAVLTLMVLALALFLCAPFVQAEEAKADTAAKSDTVKVSQAFLATWQRVGALTKKAGVAEVEKTTTVAGVRGAEAEDEIMDDLYFKGGTRYPTRKELRDVIAALNKTVKANSKAETVPEMMYFVGQCYTQLGESKKALDAYKELSKKHPKTSWSEKAKKEVKLLSKVAERKK